MEYHWLEGQFGRLPAAALAAKAATTTTPIVFGVGEDPVRLGLVASLARPGGNLTGINFFANELAAKRLAFLQELVPKAVRIAVLVNPANIPTTALRDLPEAARAIGLLADGGGCACRTWGCLPGAAAADDTT
jgi:putative tryptophan/tyrosine transport system substrate-binding protein